LRAGDVPRDRLRDHPGRHPLAHLGLHRPVVARGRATRPRGRAMLDEPILAPRRRASSWSLTRPVPELV
jgi:hypothetical protein